MKGANDNDHFVMAHLSVMYLLAQVGVVKWRRQRWQVGRVGAPFVITCPLLCRGTSKDRRKRETVCLLNLLIATSAEKERGRRLVAVADHCYAVLL